jgi:electron transfer flavoprotein alpha subunit
MSNILVVAEHQAGSLRKVTLPVLGFANAAAELTDGEVYVLVLGHGVGGVAEALAPYGAQKVLVADDAQFADYLAENWALAVAAIAEEYGCEVVCTPASTTGRDFMPRVAVALEAAQVSDAVEIFDGDEGITFRRPMLAGKVFVDVVVEADVTCVTVRTTAFEAPEAGASSAIESVDPGIDSVDTAEFVSFDMVKSDRPDLTDADVVVSGGRGLKARENFAMLEELADVLGGAVGASRAAVDSGMAPNDWQIGQTGKIVAPNLYFAVAISGAIQHIAGMKGSKTIVAINTDAEAPIFQVADYGLVADAFKVIPELTEKLRGLGD